MLHSLRYAHRPAAFSRQSRAFHLAGRGPAVMDLGGMLQQQPGWQLLGQPQAAVQADCSNTVFRQQQHQQQGISDMSTSDSDSDSGGPVRVPLKLVVQDAVKRWFNETLSEARRGDVKQQALLSQMYAEGYGCKQDLEQSKVWGERARMRGYQMAGVYDAF